MSEPIPEAIPTSADSRSRRPMKKARLHPNASASAAQADLIDDLMWDPSRPVKLPDYSADSAYSKSSLPPPPEIVANVQGSSAGAGSGEFHVYKASRRREYERLRQMDEEAKKEDDDAKWATDEQRRKQADEERTRKNREKRNRKKMKIKGVADAKVDAVMNGKAGTKKLSQNLADNPEKTNGGRSSLELSDKRTEAGQDSVTNNGAVTAEATQELGITIHDDD